MDILQSVYIDIVKYIYNNKLCEFPLEINHIFYDPKYSSAEDIEISNDDENLFMDANFYYKGIFSELEKNMNILTCICNSDDLGEDENEVGDYFYYSGIINPEVPFIYEMSTHPYHYPNRLIIFGSSYQIEISSDIQSIFVYEITMHNRYTFLSCIKDKMLRWLKETDRPRIFVNK